MITMRERRSWRCEPGAEAVDEAAHRGLQRTLDFRPPPYRLCFAAAMTESKFVYQDMLPLGADTTPYRLLTKDHVSTFEAAGRRS